MSRAHHETDEADVVRVRSRHVGVLAPTDDPPADTPPVEDPPADEPPADTLPANDPPVDEPPATDPPATEPADDDPPATDTPATEPAPAPDGNTATAKPAEAPAPTGGNDDAHPERQRADAPDPSAGDEQPLVPVSAGQLAQFIPTFTLDANLPAPARIQQISGSFVVLLSHTSEAAGADWALTLGVMRARGQSGFQMSAEQLSALASSLAGLKKNATPAQLQQRVNLDEPHAEQALALARYHRAVGKRVLVLGLEDGRALLEHRVLHHAEIHLTPWGRADVAEGRIGVRTLVVMLYLAQRHDNVTVSSLVSGHRLYSRPGVISAHVYGQAVDIASLDGISIYGGQGPGSITEQAVRDLLLLPVEAYPGQVISLHNMGGPSFAMADHHDHIHVGF